MESLCAKVVFYDDDGAPVPMEFEGEVAAFFVSLRDVFCDAENKEALGLVFGGEFSRSSGETFATGGMAGERGSLVRLAVNFILNVAGQSQGVPPKYVVCEIADMALRRCQGAARKNHKSGLILP